MMNKLQNARKKQKEDMFKLVMGQKDINSFFSAKPPEAVLHDCHAVDNPESDEIPED